MKRERVFSYKVPIYEVYVTFVITADIKLAHDKFKVPYVAENCAENGGEAHQHESKFYLFLNPNCLTHGFISHELSHTVHNICRFIGIREDFENDEAESHLLYHLTEYFYAQLARLKLPVTNQATK